MAIVSFARKPDFCLCALVDFAEESLLFLFLLLFIPLPLANLRRTRWGAEIGRKKRRACRHCSSHRVDLYSVITAEITATRCLWRRWQHSLFSSRPPASFHLRFPHREQMLSSSSTCEGVRWRRRWWWRWRVAGPSRMRDALAARTCVTVWRSRQRGGVASCEGMSREAPG